MMQSPGTQPLQPGGSRAARLPILRPLEILELLDESFDVYKRHFRLFFGIAVLVNTPVGDFSAFLSRNLFLKIKLTRENGELKYRAEAVPLVTEPTRAVIDRLRTGAGRLMGKGRGQETGDRSQSGDRRQEPGDRGQ